MKAVLTRVTRASVTVDGEVVGAIDCPETGGILALVGVGREDDPQAWETVARKIAELRILEGERSVHDAGAPVLLVSQFTLMGRTAKGRRPSWSDAAPGEVAEPVIAKIAEALRERGITVEEGRFGAMMDVESVNSGPFTVLVEA
ncbi:D-aminoacyl-tRNA deacylase [Corynebacterium sp. p3-SID1056]|uniref:D-aminoacyl-tRNA deacylase n=1 Tax=Corynebacterium sp. p3-SID1056 TaxID=2916092 RepID=UPI0021A3AEA4|nr:D-aminoacyl-tRNA deacylase [Corynebacterium sp. p3-SID1056]MCT2337736.1 D-aminoacyl-tRNA deacylase [Corynebacterium sp. p3-SID1056]